MSIVLEDLTKRYGGHPVVNGVSIEVGDGELFVLLGSSGSGKSTLLRMIAGLSEVDAGRVLLHGRDVTGLPPAKRGVGFVFQSYALFRGMSVAENVEFALAVRGVAAEQRRRRRDELLELVGLAGLGGRTPGSSRAASSRGSPWPGRWRTSRRFCCWTSRSERSTPRCAWSCAGPSGRSSGSSASRRFLSPMIKRKRSSWRTGWPC